jgi:hypothetical protein
LCYRRLRVILEFKLKGSQRQYTAIDEAIRVTQFIRNKCVRLWQDTWGATATDLSAYCRILAQEYTFVRKLNAMARQAAAERAWSAISRFYGNCKKKKAGKKGYPRFQKNCRSVEYKTTGWMLDSTRRHLTLTDALGMGTFRLRGTWDLLDYALGASKRVRLVRRADGCYESRSGKPWRVLCEVFAKLLAVLVQHWLLLVSCWAYPNRRLVKAAQTVRQHALHLASVLACPPLLCRAIGVIQCCLATGCRLNRRKTKPNTYQLLLDPALAGLA